MVAAPKDGHIILTNAPGGITVQQESFNNTDVANAYATWFSNGGLTFIIAKQDCWINDVVLEAAATDTTQMQLFIDSSDKNIRFINANVVAAVNNRLSSAIGPIKAGSQIQIKELA